MLAVLTIAIPTIQAAELGIARDEGNAFVVPGATFHVRIIKKGFRYSFHKPDGSVIAPAHASSGLQFSGGDAVDTTAKTAAGNVVSFEAINDKGRKATVELALHDDDLSFSVQTESSDPAPIVLRTGPMGRAFGMGDQGALGRTTTELTGFAEENLHAFTGGSLKDLKGVARLISNFVIFPRQGMGEVNIEPDLKVVRITDSENAQGSSRATELPAMHYFFGNPRAIYRSFLEARNQAGYRVFAPKYDWFGVGWEAWGALAWDTNHQTVSDNVNRYLDMGFPLRWMIIGSGFWPRHDPNLAATTSFGMWDPKLYPDPRGLIETFHKKGLKIFLGLRIAFISEGPYGQEGVARRYFIEEDGQAKIFKIAFPKKPVYLLDAHKPEAVKWYVGLCQKWLDYGIDGFKEDLFGYQKYVFRDDKIDPVNAALMEKGVYVMGRNGYLGSPMDIHRIEDFNQDQPQDRGPLNCLALAYSGFACPYPDIVGGTFATQEWGGKHKDPIAPATLERVKKYYMRSVQFGSVTPVMAVGFGPWNMNDPQVEQVALAAAKLHDRLQPYTYSAALDAARSGFPACMTPLPLAYPDDSEVYTLENTTRRGYQWMLGPSLLATPLYGDDFETAQSRDVYLPAGKWMDYDTGKIYQGPAILKQFPLAIGKTPLFVGGSGIVVVRGSKVNELNAVVYPVAPPKATYRFNHPDGNSISQITAHHSNWDSEKVIVKDVKTGAKIKMRIDSTNGSVIFPIEPGHDYLVTN